MISKFTDIDALIFDMDGTMWNATESYAKVWNRTCDTFGIKCHFDGVSLEKYMGLSIDSIMVHLLGTELNFDKELFLETLFRHEQEMMPSLGGILYPGVMQSLPLLQERFKLFMLSNCSARGLVNFVNSTGTAQYFDGLLTQGERHVEKSENLRYMIERYSLKNPVYIGDTQNDCDQAHLAGIPFIFAQWGFGSCLNPDVSFESFIIMIKSLIGK